MMDVAEVQRRARSGPIAMLFRRLVAVVIGLLTTVTIPHLVSPAAYGIAAMSTVLFALAEMFKDFGVTSALLRKGEVHPEEVNFLFWFNAATTVVLAAILAAAAPFAARFFHTPAVAQVIWVSLIGFVVGGLSLQHRELLSRDLRFALVALVDTIGLVGQFAATLGLALLGFGVWALVLGSVAGTVIGAIIFVVRSEWRPQRPALIPNTKEILRFGANTFVYSLAVFTSNNITSVLFGRFFSPEILGQYNRAYALMQIPMKNAVEPVASATLPVMARLRIVPHLYKSAYLDLISRLNIFVIPASIIIAFGGHQIALAVLGSRWGLSGYLLQSLAPAVATWGMGYALGDLFITQNRTHELALVGMAETVIRVSAILVGLHFGAIQAALGFSISTVVVTAIRVCVGGRSGPVNILDHFNAITPALAPTLGAIIGCSLAVFLVIGRDVPPIGAACLICGLGGVVAAASAFATPASRRVLLELGAAFKIPVIRQVQ